MLETDEDFDVLEGMNPVNWAGEKSCFKIACEYSQLLVLMTTNVNLFPMPY